MFLIAYNMLMQTMQEGASEVGVYGRLGSRE